MLCTDNLWEFLFVMPFVLISVPVLYSSALSWLQCTCGSGSGGDLVVVVAVGLGNTGKEQ